MKLSMVDTVRDHTYPRDKLVEMPLHGRSGHIYVQACGCDSISIYRSITEFSFLLF